MKMTIGARASVMGIMVLAVAMGGVTTQSDAQVAGTTKVGVAVAELDIVAKGWSAKKHILGEPIFNEQGNRVGTVQDLIVSPQKAISYAIVGTGGFIGLPKHDVAIPVSQFEEKGGKFILAGATKETIKALPQFQYAQNVKPFLRDMSGNGNAKQSQ